MVYTLPPVRAAARAASCSRWCAQSSHFFGDFPPFIPWSSRSIKSAKHTSETAACSVDLNACSVDANRSTTRMTATSRPITSFRYIWFWLYISVCRLHGWLLRWTVWPFGCVLLNSQEPFCYGGYTRVYSLILDIVCSFRAWPWVVFIPRNGSKVLTFCLVHLRESCCFDLLLCQLASEGFHLVFSVCWYLRWFCRTAVVSVQYCTAFRNGLAPHIT